MNESLCIMTWNANGIQLHKHEIELLLKNDEVYVLLLSETHLIEGSRIYLENYHCYHAHHPSGCARGGAAVIINTLQRKIDSVVQAAFIAIKNAVGQKLTLGAVISATKRTCRWSYISKCNCFDKKILDTSWRLEC